MVELFDQLKRSLFGPLIQHGYSGQFVRKEGKLQFLMFKQFNKRPDWLQRASNGYWVVIILVVTLIIIYAVTYLRNAS